MTRRKLLLSSLTADGFGTRPIAGAMFDASLVGANTAIAGAELFEAISLLKNTGFQAIEFHPWGSPNPAPGVFPGFEFDRIDDGVKRKIRAALEGFRHKSAHLLHTGPNYFSADPAEAAAGLRQIGVGLEGALYFGATLLVLHARAAKGVPREKHWPIMIGHVRRWADRAAKAGACLTIETGYPGSVQEFVQLVREVDHEAVGATIDVGHQRRYKELVERVAPAEQGTESGIRAYNDTNIDLVRRLGPKLLHLHMHDIDPPTWQEHRPLGTGFIDYPRFLRELKQAGYGGMFMLEIAGQAQDMPRYLADSKRRFEAFLA